jgi:2,5-diamino-6-(ribosylamino)-4(3H)-pyrimidinone 5'-phosphate reductase
MTSRPYVICHMMASIDGRIDSAVSAVADEGDYEGTGQTLGGDAWVCGRTTMEQHFAEGAFVSRSGPPAGPRPVHVARRAESYAVAVDTTGKLRWSGGDLSGDHLICVVSERAADDYLEMLREKGISYIVAGTSEVDLPRAVAALGEHFGIRCLLLEGGGHINGAFLRAGLVDEVSLLLVPGVDGRAGVPAVFDGIGPGGHALFPLRLKSVDQRGGGTLWIRYDVARPSSSLGGTHADAQTR